jgi:hypothetical protein
MSLFSRHNSQQLGRDTAKQLVSGHLALVAYWALRHANVIDAMNADGINIAVFAAKTSMAGDVLEALLNYLASAGLAEIENGHAKLTPAGKAVREHEDGVLEMVRAYQPALSAIEHFLARLKTYGGAHARKNDLAADSQGTRFSEEVFPALEKAILKSGATHILDLNCANASLLLRLGTATKNLAGVGVVADSLANRKANESISKAGFEKRFIAVTGNPLDICKDPRDAFERLGISAIFWEQLDCVVACNVFGELAGRDATTAIAALARLPRIFPGATIFLAEATEDADREPPYYAAELALLLAIGRHKLLPAQQWRDMLQTAGLKLAAETSLTTDSLTLFACAPTQKPAKKSAAVVSPGA